MLSHSAKSVISHFVQESTHDLIAFLRREMLEEWVADAALSEKASPLLEMAGLLLSGCL